MKKSIVILVCLTLIQPVFSQPKNSISGYLITMSNDTMMGSIKLLNNAGYMMVVKYWNPVNKKTKEYRADKIKGFCYDNRYFESLVWQESHYYFERIIKAHPVSLYATPYNSPGVVVPVGVVGVFVMPSGRTFNEYFIIDSSSMTLLNHFGFRKFMVNYVKDCPALVNKIDTKELNFDDLKQIIEEYNLCSKN